VTGVSRLFVVAGVAGFTSWVCTGALIPWLRHIGLMDRPNQRSSHKVPTPRAGGLGILAGAAVSVVIGTNFWLRVGFTRDSVAIGLCTLAMAAIGFIDDVRGEFPVKFRLAMQLMLAAIVIAVVGPIPRCPFPPPADFDFGVFAWPLTLLWIVAVTNIFNFLDGIDGYAGLQGVLAGSAIAVWHYGTWPAVWGAAIAGGCLGFLIHNWHPARVFMGDVGSLTLGFLFATLPLVGSLEGGSPQAIFVTAFSLWFFLTDGSFTIVRRLLKRERIWSSHRSHLYQRLVTPGVPHSRVATGILCCGALLTAWVLAAARASAGSQWLLVVGGIAVFLVYWVVVVTNERRLAVARPAGSSERSPSP